MSSTLRIHEVATTGFDNATSYDKHRPSYSPSAVQILLENLGVANSPGARIVDLAAGTGKFTEALALREEGFDVLAVEPHESMRKTLEAKKLKGVASRTGTAESMDVEDGWADAVIVAQAFHWFAKVEALQEIRRVLKPGGKLSVIWNIEDWNKPKAWPAATDLEQGLNELIFSSQTDGQPRFRDNVWSRVFDEQKGLFSTPIAQDKEDWTVWLTTEALWDRLRTISHVAVLEGSELASYRSRFDTILKERAGKWNDQGEVAIHGVTTFSWTSRL